MMLNDPELEAYAYWSSCRSLRRRQEQQLTKQRSRQRVKEVLAAVLIALCFLFAEFDFFAR